MTTPPLTTQQPFFHKTNKVSPGENVPVLTKVRSGRWLHVQHLLPTEPVMRQGSRSNEDWNGTAKKHGAQGNEGKFQLHHNWEHIPHANKDYLGNHEHKDNHIKTHHKDEVDSFSSSATQLTFLPGTSKNSPDVPQKTRRPLLHRDSESSLLSVFDRDGGTVLFFIHGVGGSSALWYYQIQYFLEQGFEIVAPDLYGHGYSDAPRSQSAYSFYELAEDTLAIFDKYCKKRNILIGHSYGSSFCTVIARERERKVTKMVLLSGGGPVSLEPQLCHIFCLPSCLLACLKPLLTRVFLRQAFHKPLPRVPSGNFSAFNVPSYVLRGTMQGQYWPDGNQEYHAALNVAVLLIYGLQDEFVTLDETQWMHETIFASSLETIEAGHMLMLECPEHINQLIHQFLLKDMIIRPKTGRQEEAPKGSPSPALSRKKTMPHLMPGGLSLS